MTGRDPGKRRTPVDASEFEREQLRFLLTRGDLTATLTEINPSIAWLPWLSEVKLLQPNTQLAPWIEKNFFDPDSVRDVAASIHFFNADTAEVLESRLHRQSDTLPPVLAQSWRLIVQYMRGARSDTLTSEWFDIEPRIRKGDRSPEILERLARALRPKLKISRYFAWRQEPPKSPKAPTDLMSIEFEVEDGLDDQEVLSTWPIDAQAEVDEKLLEYLTVSINAALANAVDAGVESDRGYSTSDSDVPSIAAHHQNAHHGGFQPIARVSAEIWSRLASKDVSRALRIYEFWRQSAFRLGRRLALFAAANPIVSASAVTKILAELPQSELFLTSASVEIHRLLRQRWPDLDAKQREAIQRRVAEGPPAEAFREGTSTARFVDRCRFDLLGDLERAGLELTDASRELLIELRKRWPEWELRPSEQAGFQVWSGGADWVAGDAKGLENVPDELLVAAAQKAAEADRVGNDPWRVICENDPRRARRALEAQATQELWPVSAWTNFLAATRKIEASEDAEAIVRLLLGIPDASFVEIASAASWWLSSTIDILDDALLWALWDKIAACAPRSVNEVEDAGSVH